MTIAHLSHWIPTERERAVARLVAAGKSNKEIGMALGISKHTARAHLRQLYGKLGAGNRVAFVVAWLHSDYAKEE